MELNQLIEQNKQIISRHLQAIEFLNQYYNYENLSKENVVQKLKDYFELIVKEVVSKNMSVVLLEKKAIKFDCFYFLYTECNFSSSIKQQMRINSTEGDENAEEVFVNNCQLEKQVTISKKQLRQLHQILFCLKYILTAIQKDIHITKREIYYSNVDLFDKDQKNLNHIIQLIQNQLQIPRQFLNIIASAKGLISGNIQFKIEGQNEIIDLSKNIGDVRQIQPSQNLEWLSTHSKFILILEKETVFQKIINERHQQLLQNSCIITAKGYGDYSTKEFIKKIAINEPQIPIFYLGDCDPFGIDILFNYTFGSQNSSYQFDNLPNIHYLGLFMFDILELQNQVSISYKQNKQTLSFEDIQKLDYLISQIQLFNKNINGGQDEVIKYQMKRWKGWEENAKQIKNNKLKYEIEDIYPYLDSLNTTLSLFILNKIYNSNFL